MKPKRIRLSRARGWRLPEGAVNVARPGKWGNPFVVGRDGTREQCVAKYYQLCCGFIDLGCATPTVDEQMAAWRYVHRNHHKLAGKDLACWCALDGKPCHADILLLFASGVLLPDWAKQPLDIGRVRLGMRATDWDKLERAHRRRWRPVVNAIAEFAQAFA